MFVQRTSSPYWVVDSSIPVTTVAYRRDRSQTKTSRFHVKVLKMSRHLRQCRVLGQPCQMLYPHPAVWLQIRYRRVQNRRPRATLLRGSYLRSVCRNHSRASEPLMTCMDMNRACLRLWSAEDFSRHQIFFETFQPSQPFIHKGRYLAAMSLPATSRLRPPVCLSYAIWALAASMSEHYDAVAEHFYLRARKYMEVDEILGRGQGVVTLAHAQATAYLAVYETKRLYFPRAWLSVGRAARLCHMMNLHRLDGIGLNVKETLPSSTTWIEQEERRRTFWGVFVHDRYQSIASGWPTIFDERDVSSSQQSQSNQRTRHLMRLQITTNLPCNEEDFMHGTPSPTSLSLNDALNPAGEKTQLPSKCLAQILIAFQA